MFVPLKISEQILRLLFLFYRWNYHTKLQIKTPFHWFDFTVTHFWCQKPFHLKYSERLSFTGIETPKINNRDQCSVCFCFIFVWFYFWSFNLLYNYSIWRNNKCCVYFVPLFFSCTKYQHNTKVLFLIPKHNIINWHFIIHKDPMTRIVC